MTNEEYQTRPITWTVSPIPDDPDESSQVQTGSFYSGTPLNSSEDTASVETQVSFAESDKDDLPQSQEPPREDESADHEKEPEKAASCYKRIFYVDYENSGEKRLEGISVLKKGDLVKLFYSEKQTINLDLLQLILKSEADFEYIRNEIKHQQAVDIQILLDIYKSLALTSGAVAAQHIILSGDNGYDTDIKELKQKINIKKQCSIGNREAFIPTFVGSTFKEPTFSKGERTEISKCLLAYENDASLKKALSEFINTADKVNTVMEKFEPHKMLYKNW